MRLMVIEISSLIMAGMRFSLPLDHLLSSVSDVLVLL